MVKVIAVTSVLALGTAVFLAYIYLVRFPKREVEPQYVPKLPTLSDLAGCFPDVEAGQVVETRFQRTMDSRIDLHYDAEYLGRQIVSVERRIWTVNRSAGQLTSLVEEMANAMNALPGTTAKAVRFKQDFAVAAGAVQTKTKDGLLGLTLVFANLDGALYIAFSEGPCTEPNAAFERTHHVAKRALSSN